MASSDKILQGLFGFNIMPRCVHVYPPHSLHQRGPCAPCCPCLQNVQTHWQVSHKVKSGTFFIHNSVVHYSFLTCINSILAGHGEMVIQDGTRYPLPVKHVSVVNNVGVRKGVKNLFSV